MRTSGAGRLLFWCSAILTLLLAFPALSRAQLVLGQYEDEAPLRTWNTLGFQTAASVGRGGTAFTMAADCSVALSNPALLLDLPRFTATLNGTSYYTSLFKYSIVNTGVLETRQNPSFILYDLDFGGVSYRYGDWAFAAATAIIEIYGRPSTGYEAIYQGSLYYSLDFSQAGVLRDTNFSVARRLGRRFQAGLGINVISGNLTREIVEREYFPEVTITSDISQDFSGFFLNGGVSALITDRWSASLIFRTSWTKKAQDTSKLQYLAPAGGTDIVIAADSSDTYKQPLVLGAGIKYSVSEKFAVASDLTYFNWSGYKVEYFGEEQARDFRDTVKLAFGAQYLIGLRVFRAAASIPVRVGFVYDPQPVRNPASAYTYFSAGAGFYWKMLALDFGASIGQESGSGNSLEARRLALSLSLRL